MYFCMNNDIFTFNKLLNRFNMDKRETSFVIWREQDIFGTLEYPVKIDIPCLFICLTGEMKIEINLQPYIFDSKHLLCFTTPTACRIIDRSCDFKCVGILLSKVLWRKLTLADQSLGMISIRNASIETDNNERERLIQFYKLLTLCSDALEEHSNTDSIIPIVAGMLYQVRNICKRQENSSMQISHSKKILYNFLDLLHSNYRMHRRVTFYADKLSLTPRHLTTVIRQTSGKSVIQWIEEYLILEAQILLKNSTLSIKEIAYELGFNDQSLFSKYFTRIYGKSPEKYRKS